MPFSIFGAISKSRRLQRKKADFTAATETPAWPSPARRSDQGNQTPWALRIATYKIQLPRRCRWDSGTQDLILNSLVPSSWVSTRNTAPFEAMVGARSTTTVSMWLLALSPLCLSLLIMEEMTARGYKVSPEWWTQPRQDPAYSGLKRKAWTPHPHPEHHAGLPERMLE